MARPPQPPTADGGRGGTEAPRAAARSAAPAGALPRRSRRRTAPPRGRAQARLAAKRFGRRAPVAAGHRGPARRDRAAESGVRAAARAARGRRSDLQALATEGRAERPGWTSTPPLLSVWGRGAGRRDGDPRWTSTPPLQAVCRVEAGRRDGRPRWTSTPPLQAVCGPRRGGSTLGFHPVARP